MVTLNFDIGANALGKLSVVNALRKLDVIIDRFPRGFRSATDWPPLFFLFKKEEEEFRRDFQHKFSRRVRACCMIEWFHQRRENTVTYLFLSFFFLLFQSSPPGTRHVSIRLVGSHAPQSQTRGKLGVTVRRRSWRRQWLTSPLNSVIVLVGDQSS